uniref:Uncharacterized protein n=1 Tax=Timema poppense TaxID=170557 RepID=A0A7R9DLA7_TIMPO|nr:unnamed protein product [Timema poppensis]
MLYDDSESWIKETVRRKIKLPIKRRINSVLRVTCCHCWSQVRVRSALAHFVTIQTDLHLIA